MNNMEYINLISQLYEFETPEIADALDACGVESALLGIKPMVQGIKIAGPAFTVQYSSYLHKPNEFQNAGNYIDDVPAKSIIVIDNQGREDCTVWGNILTQFAMMKNITGTIINGAARDILSIRQTSYPLYAKGIYMRSGKNRVYKSDQQCALVINNIWIHPGDFIFADDNGVLVIPQELLSNVIEKANNIKTTEERILKSIKSGATLKSAREKFQYHKPWLGNENG